MTSRRRWWGALAVAVALAACSDPNEPGAQAPDASPPVDAGPDAPVDAAAADAGAGGADAGLAPSFCTAETPTVVAQGAGVLATTTHYELYAETSQAVATEYAKLLEASGKAFSDWFARPQPTERLKVKVYKDSASWKAGLAADGVSAPAEAGGYFTPTTKTAYLFLQANPYYSRVLLVHEATHQFHILTRAKGSLPFWYAEGHAEHLSRHDWDGACVRLGVTSTLSWEDLPAAALAQPKVDVAAIVSGQTTGTRADAWAIFRFLDTGADRAKFAAYRDAMDSASSPSFDALVGPAPAVGAALAAWLPSAQEPMHPVYTEWTHRGPGAVDVDTPAVFSLATLKSSAATHLDARFEIPKAGKYAVGVVVSYVDPTHYVGVVHGSDGKVRTFTASGSAIWNDVGTAPGASGGFETFSVDLAGGKATVTFNGGSVNVSAPTPRLGLAANDTTGAFSEVHWR